MSRTKNIKEENAKIEEQVVEHLIVDNLYNFSKISFTDSVSSDTFKIMNDETVARCFENGMYLPHVAKVSANMSILKHCSNFPVDEFNDDELYMICVYSNLNEILANLSSEKNNKFDFITTVLNDSIAYEKDRIVHNNKLNDIIDVLIQYLDENADVISKAFENLTNGENENTIVDENKM